MQPCLPMGKEHKDYAWSLIAKKLSGDATPEELKELETLLRNNPELHYPLQTISDLWRHTSPHDKEQAEKAFSEHVDRMSDLKIDYTFGMLTGEDPFPARRRPYRRIALFVTPAACLITGLLWSYRSHSARTSISSVAAVSAAVRTNNGSEIYTANGSRTHLSLPDGSKVWLNAG